MGCLCTVQLSMYGKAQAYITCRWCVTSQFPHTSNSFPGGLCEEGENPINAAIRETWEELGIKPDLIDILGALTELPDSVTVSGAAPGGGFT